MRRLIQYGIIQIEQQEKKALNDSVRDFFVRIKMLFMHKFKMSYGDRRMTEKLLSLIQKFPIDVGMQLDQAIERKKAAKQDKKTSTKLIIRDFIQDLKAFAGRLEDGLSERLTEEDEENNVRAIARCASAELRANSAHKDLILAVEEEIRLCQEICSLWEGKIQNT